VYDGVHSGQVSFPGGKFDPGESDPVQVALRETFEEVGVAEHEIRVAGVMSPLYIPPSNIMVFPVVGIMPEEPKWKPDPHEVELLIHEPLIPWLREQQIAETAHKVAPGLAISAPYYDIQQHRVWGATAMMLSEFAEIMKRVGLP
jgi:8-oxo-dGTP pyrophosphatase MutT (NUDIX family)